MDHASEERSLARLLLVLTCVSGLVDAASYLSLGHTFVANMTGNIVFVGLTLGGAGGLSLVNSAAAVAAFFAGALGAGRLERRFDLGRPERLGLAATIELAMVLVALVIRLAAPRSGTVAAVAVLAAAMGIQSTITTRLQVPGFNSTVVLTTMLGTMAAGSRAAGGSGENNCRRALAITSMLLGGLVGALLTYHLADIAPLVAAAVALALTGAGAHAVAQKRRAS